MINDIYIECGKIVNTHGCKGAVKAQSWCNSENELAALKRIFLKNGALFYQLNVRKASIFKQFVIFEFDTVDDMDKAMLLKESVIYAAREDFKLAEGEFFIADLIGISVIDEKNGKIYGTLKEIINRGASDIYVVQTDNGERMIPAVDEFVIRVDISNGIYIRPIEGMFD